MSGVSILALNESGLDLARRIRTLVTEAEIHAPAKVTTDVDHIIDGPLAPHLQALFRDGTTILGICAAGILIRALGPLLADKHNEPPVLALAVDGSSVVPLLGGHRGANELARRLARDLGAHAALTTSSDLLTGTALDDPPDGWTTASAEALRPLLARVRRGERLGLTGCFAAAAPWLDKLRDPTSEAGDLQVDVRRPDNEGTPVIHPRALAVGVGTDRGCPPEELIALVRTTLDQAGLAEDAVGCVVSIDLKTGEPAVHALAQTLGVPARFFSPSQLEAETPRLASPSAVVFQEIGCHGVAEGAALAAVGASGRLLVPKTKTGRATCAIAQAEAPLVPMKIGRPAGELHLLSLGPGAREHRTRGVDSMLQRCTDLVGFSAYLDAIEATVTARRHPFTLGEEVDRCRHALDLAAAGSVVGLVGSGDVGVYAMAAPLFELVANAAHQPWNRLRIQVWPGVSAMHLGAARLGAPLGHDFAAISLSDLMTPWSVIDERLRAAAAGDFVVALYNPVSRRRIVGFERALAIFRTQRPSATPCLIGRQLGRADERLEVLPLGELQAERVDMLSLVLIGSRHTQLWRNAYDQPRLITPRGYPIDGEDAA